ncbi:hypothetical protein FRC12_004195 [Ceratobasidium sp. 428]|nr:hypothetical protein FRC12_004195 [Ceratobasidium sp. 428]
MRNLSAISLVSRNWQALTFPDLYRAGRAPDLEQLATRIVANNSQLPISKHLRRLIVDQGPNCKYAGKAYSISAEHLASLATLLSAAPHLEHFAWELPFFLPIQNITENVRSRCLSLSSIHFLIEDSNCFWSEPYNQILALTNLKHISLDITCLRKTHDFDEDHAKALASLIRSCPEIQSINLDFNSPHSRGGRWSPGVLCSHFDDVTFCHLDTFRALGGTDTDRFVYSAENNPLHRFFLRHPNLHTIGLDWVPEAEYTRRIPPTLMGSLFPSIRHAEVPGFLCAHIIASELAVQIESITIADPFWNEPSGLSLDMISYSGRLMPNLRRLTFYPKLRHPDNLDGLKGILLLAPELEVLELGKVFTRLVGGIYS